MATPYDDVPKKARARAWYSRAGAYAYLVDAPLTFGHSQLWVPRPVSKSEEDAFLEAAQHVAACIHVLRGVLPGAVAHWEELAKYTRTERRYVKTLVLRASAAETRREYKIHLVPFFGSHRDTAKRLHQVTLGLARAKPGGLLHWVGERECVVDYDTQDRESSAYRKRMKALRLRDLAKRLRSGAP